MTTTTPTTTSAVAALVRWYDEIQAALRHVGASHRATGFHPAFELPAPTDAVVGFLGAGELSFDRLGEVAGRELTLLDLTRNPGTRTTKTMASLVMVARAVRQIQATGEPIMIVTPSSANKATALRDAVLRAYRHGLVTPDQLQIVTVVPGIAREKLWSSALSEAPLSGRNPMCVYHSDVPSDVKTIADQAVGTAAPLLRDRHGINVWYSLNLDNYRPADTVRAFAERDLLPTRPGSRRVHAHSVSSAYGLLGHHLGRVLDGGDAGPGYFLVQHLATPDMVLSLYHGSADPANLPAYTYDPKSFLYRQDTDPHFPAATYDPAENLEPTFYTRSPVTSAEMNSIIAAQGGGGIVVSLYECLERYPQIRQMLSGTSIQLPADPRKLREWSLVMALTGVVNACERGLIEADEVVVHGSGSYGTDDYRAIPADRLTTVDDAAALHEVLLAAGEAAWAR
ncbi:hypothetical protein Cs7R123_15450 [Catellatospora sp. TT07R-123]|uniref:DUF6002 family protein n=1 Tax=Catellatospora sp. TT07R-123 TaxID=2733863 RepID=UPI001B06BBD4|nr:DUF6002 family protein [Catellatospora sp. TT07R-123]GHJ44203.1 hypothetical protein Cs7R123_15450 [Catellatospora sp. TT07R-123]